MFKIKEDELQRRVNACFRRNDLRCIYKREINEHLTHHLGIALVKYLKCKKVVVGHDMRTSSPKLCDALIKGILESGADVIHLDYIDTPALYFASGFWKLPGVMITASHNPKNYNGFKIVNKGAIPISDLSGLNEIKKIICKQNLKKSKKPGKLIHKDISKQYRRFLHSFINLKSLAKLKIVVDAGNGMAGKMAPIIYKNLPLRIIKMYFKLDGNFPNHVPNPAIKKNIKDIKEKVKKTNSDLGIAFDGDMDRVVFIDNKGRAIESSITSSLISKELLKKHKKGKIVYNLVMSSLLPEIIKKNNGKPLREKVGHSYIKARMRKEKAIFGCEHTGHFYYKKNYYADSAFITSLLMLDIVSKLKKNNKKISEEVDKISKYAKIEETSLKMKDKKKKIKKIEKAYKKRKDFIKTDHLDGLTMSFTKYWFNIRPSGTEPLLRVNLEAQNKMTMNSELKILLSKLKS